MLKRHLLSCKDVSHLASEYLDKHTEGKITFKIRLHLMFCRCCRRFVKHLRITKFVVAKIAQPNSEIDAESVLKRIKEKSANTFQPNG